MLKPFEIPSLQGRPVELKEFYETVQQWVDHVTRVQDLGMRRRMLLDKMADLSPAALAEALYFILRNAQMGRTAFQEVLDAVTDLDPLIQRSGRPFFSDVYRYARRKGYEEVVHFLRKPRPKAGLKTDYFPDPDQLANELSLGQRRSLAMSPDPDTLEHLLFDPDPVVVRKLLLNSRLTLPMVVRITARRPNKPAVLAEIFQSPRWSVQYDVKVALVRNHYTPPPIALRLLPALRVQDLREVAADSTLLPEIQQAAQDLLAKRGRES